MNKLKKTFFAVAVAAALGLVAASTASAQVQFFVSASSARQVRAEGLAEAVGVISFASNSTPGAVPAGSIITLDFGTTVQPIATGGTTPWGTVTSTCTGGNANVAPTVSGNVVTLTFTAADTCAAGSTVSFAGARVNANALGAGASITVGVAATSTNQATQPITLISVGSLTIANVQPAPSTAVSFTPGVILFCTASTTTTTPVVVSFTVTEKFATAFLSAADEATLSTGGTISSFRVRFAFTGIPIGVRIVTATIGTGTTVTATTSGAPFTSTAADQDQDVDATITVTSLTAIDTLVVNFGFDVPNTGSLTTTDASGIVRVTLRGASDLPGAPVFSSSGSSRQVNDQTVIRALACASYLLFTWVANTGDGAYDTGLVVSNTTKDPSVIGTVGQTGDITLYFFPTDGSAPTSKVLKTGVKPGESVPVVVSTFLGAKFTGYVIAHCTFQMGHGFAFINNPGLVGGAFAEGYLAINLTNPRLAVGATTEHLGP